MRSLTSFTPYFAEDVTYALEELHGELNDNVDLLHLLQSIFPDECANATAPHTPFRNPSFSHTLPCTRLHLPLHSPLHSLIPPCTRALHLYLQTHTPSRTLTHPHTLLRLRRYANFTERMGVPGLSASREESSKFDEFELGRWASDRGQLLSRTVTLPPSYNPIPSTVRIAR